MRRTDAALNKRLRERDWERKTAKKKLNYLFTSRPRVSLPAFFYLFHVSFDHFKVFFFFFVLPNWFSLWNKTVAVMFNWNVHYSMKLIFFSSLQSCYKNKSQMQYHKGEIFKLAPPLSILCPRMLDVFWKQKKKIIIKYLRAFAFECCW